MRSAKILFLIVAIWASAIVSVDAAPPYKQQKDVVFGEAAGDLGLLMDVFTPVGKKNGLAIINVVSAGWYSDRGHPWPTIREEVVKLVD